MRPLYRGLLVALLHCLIVLSLSGKYAWDRARLPRVWVLVTPADPNLPVRGRYLSLLVHVEPLQNFSGWSWAKLRIADGKLVADRSDTFRALSIFRLGSSWVLTQPISFFLPEQAANPTPTTAQAADGVEMWAEVSVPAEGPPRPIRLGLKKKGVLRPLDLR